MSDEQQKQPLGEVGEASFQPSTVGLPAVKRSSRIQSRVRPVQHKCDQCDESFDNSWDLKCHQESAHPKKKYRCNVCNQEFIWKRSVPRHMKQKHAASISSIMPNEPEALADKAETETEGSPPTMEEGPFRREKHTPKQRKLLPKPAAKNGPFFCEICNAKYANSSGLWKHQKRGTCLPSNAESESLIEDVRDAMEESATQVIGHSSGNEDVSKVRGILPIKKRKTSKKLDTIKQKERGKFECHVCHSTFTLAYNLTRHKGRAICKKRKAKDLNVTPKNKTKNASGQSKPEIAPAPLSECIEKKPGEFKCDICHSTFSWYRNLLRHKHRNKSCRELQMKQNDLKLASGGGQKKHVGKFKCHLCHGTFTMLSNLKRHKRDDVCKRRFKTKNEDVKNRTNVKLGKDSSKKMPGSGTHENRYCVSCAVYFPTRDLLKDHHIKTHQKTIFTCVVCPAWFTRRDRMISHVAAAHKKKKIYRCLYCPMKFLNFNAMRNHKKAFHLKALYKCTTCKKSFANQKSLRDHQKSTGHGVTSKNMAIKINARGEGNTSEETVMQEGTRKSQRMRRPKRMFSPSASPEKENVQPGEEPAPLKTDAESMAAKPVTVDKTSLRTINPELNSSPAEEILSPSLKRADSPGMDSSENDSSGSSDVQENPPMKEENEQEETGEPTIRKRKAKPQKKQWDSLFFLHMNRYDPDSV